MLKNVSVKFIVDKAVALGNTILERSGFVLKKYKPIHKEKKSKRYNGIFNPEHGDIELDSEIVSATEMTGAVPAAREEYEDDAFEEYYL